MFNVLEVKALLSPPRGLNCNIILRPPLKPFRPVWRGVRGMLNHKSDSTPEKTNVGGTTLIYYLGIK